MKWEEREHNNERDGPLVQRINNFKYCHHISYITGTIVSALTLHCYLSWWPSYKDRYKNISSQGYYSEVYNCWHVSSNTPSPGFSCYGQWSCQEILWFSCLLIHQTWEFVYPTLPKAQLGPNANPSQKNEKMTEIRTKSRFRVVPPKNNRSPNELNNTLRKNNLISPLLIYFVKW